MTKPILNMQLQCMRGEPLHPYVLPLRTLEDQQRAIRYIMKPETKIRGGVEGKDIFILDKEGYVEALLHAVLPRERRPTNREVFEAHEHQIRYGNYAE